MFVSFWAYSVSFKENNSYDSFTSGTESDLRKWDPIQPPPHPIILIYLQFGYLMYELNTKYLQFINIRAYLENIIKF